MHGQGPLILDGGLATTLESLGVALHPTLWSAGTFAERPEAVRDVHERFLRAGADIITSASYQMRAGPEMGRTVEVAREACRRARPRSRVAGSVGPYGAVLADGSEYVGHYEVETAALTAFHRPRLAALAPARPDWLALETIPAIDEVRVLCDEIDRLDRIDGWISFSCRDGAHLADGTPIGEAASVASRARRIVAVGVNCVPPAHVSELIDAIRSRTSKPIVVYPNSGESWEATSRSWNGTASTAEFVRLADEWARRGVWAVGGCCRVGPETIAGLADHFRG